MIDRQTLAIAATENVRQALAEDVGSGDISAALISDNTIATAEVITRQDGIFCGSTWVEETVKQVDELIVLNWHVEDGDKISAEQKLFTLRGPARSLLTAERTLLNFVQLLSGTATKTAAFLALIQGQDTILLDTRKTIPGLRVAQKYAVTCGGGSNHRQGLFDAFLLKENHIAAAGSIAAAVAEARRLQPDLPIEVEVENLDELAQAIAAGADIAMIDNFSIRDTVTAVTRSRGLIKLEASGGINENSITEIAATGVDYISSGELTKNVDPLDLSMRFTD
ncbi:MAG: carboxylating nicotinate-nucleotide diphosphorylase [Gammaproteobacteria bacterium]|nr:carboxylating nicotinate-nucleotide diphosphorylase [Gammaproteobacteria bacterium]